MSNSTAKTDITHNFASNTDSGHRGGNMQSLPAGQGQKLHMLSYAPRPTSHISRIATSFNELLFLLAAMTLMALLARTTHFSCSGIFGCISFMMAIAAFVRSCTLHYRLGVSWQLVVSATVLSAAGLVLLWPFAALLIYIVISALVRTYRWLHTSGLHVSIFGAQSDGDKILAT